MASNSTPSPSSQPAQSTQGASGQTTTAQADAGKAEGAKADGEKTQAAKPAQARRGQDAAAKGSAGGQSRKTQRNGGTGKSDGEAITMLKNDHRQVEHLFKEFESATDARKAAIVIEACQALTLHTMLEEEVFYPACREAAREEDDLDEAQVEHDSAKVLIADLAKASRDDPFRDAKFTVLAEQIRHHVKEEEGDDGIFAKAREAGVDTPELAAQLKELRGELEAEDRLPPQAPVSFDAFPRAKAPNNQERTMASYQGRENGDYGRGGRDDRGRFAGQGGRRSEEDDRRGGRGSQDRPRDEEGRFMSDDRGRSSRGREDDDRDYRSRGAGSRGRDDRDDNGDRGRGGWFGDSAGHSQASRKGWDRSDHEGSGWYGDSRGHSEASRRGWENSDHEGSGWYGDSRGHSEASRKGWENSDHEGSGWYGDPRGHSEASRRGWDERGSSSRGGRYDDADRRSSRSRDDDDDRSRSRRMSHDDDDDRGRSRGGRDDDRGHGGWFGDSRGHSEASRKGWESRH
ncbi:hemerythrin superfamily protein [Novosphingobium capsulatum]|uniref:Hemerythrin superfamily protein n=1 Tax=Novosphingobium capsulatum TaxID=13688 RepID=A0ABU1MJF2_9SPHN|nr:hemerythrin domain-containing protein [Novosphingobium capsulatum]MDR6510466.1 hemerythrin superfamily protein [Novosphingobium capsulatum]